MIIIQLDYQDIDLVTIRTNYNNKIKDNYLRYIVDEFSLEKAIKEMEENKWVVALDYVGDLEYLFNITNKPSKPIIVTKKLLDINELSIDFIMQTMPDWVIVSIKTPSNFCDMRVVERLSKKYSNIRFCGGKFLRLPNCNVGCIQREDIPIKIRESAISYSTEGCSCIITTLKLEEVENYEFIYKSMIEEKEKKRLERKKSVSGLEDLLTM